MDDDYQIIATSFQRVIETVAMAVDDLAAPIARAVGLLTGCLLQDGKIIVCGNGVDASLAQLLSSNLLGCFGPPRPAGAGTGLRQRQPHCDCHLAGLQ